jgi:hypothetical protein
MLACLFSFLLLFLGLDIATKHTLCGIHPGGAEQAPPVKRA